MHMQLPHHGLLTSYRKQAVSITNSTSLPATCPGHKAHCLHTTTTGSVTMFQSSAPSCNKFFRVICLLCTGHALHRGLKCTPHASNGA